MTKLHEIPSVGAYLNGLEKIREHQLKALSILSEGKNPFGEENQTTWHHSTGIITPENQSYLIKENGDITFTEAKFSKYMDKEVFPPFSTGEFTLSRDNDFKIDYMAAVSHYNENKEFAMKENEQILNSQDFKPDHSVGLLAKDEMHGLNKMLEDNGVNSNTPEVAALLETHFSKIEKVLSDFQNKIENSPKEDIAELNEKMLDKVRQAFSDLKESLKNFFLEKQVQVKTNIDNKVNDVSEGIKNKVNDVKIDINNAVSAKVQSAINDRIKNISSAIDDKFKVIEKPDKQAQQQTEKEAATETPAEPPKVEKTEQLMCSADEARSLLDSYYNSLKDQYNIPSIPGGFTGFSVNKDRADMYIPHEEKDFGHTFSLDLKTGKGSLVLETPDSNSQVKVKKTEVKTFDLQDLRKNSLTKDGLNKEKTEKDMTVLKNFVKSVKSKHPDVYSAVYKELAANLEGKKQEQTQDQPKSKPKEKEALEI